MAETLTVQITAKDGATQVFKAVASSAQQVGKAVEDAGRKGDAGFDKVEKGAKDAERAVGRVSDEAKRATVSFSDFNIAITAIGAGLLKAGDMALQQQQTIVGLESAYGDAADEMLRFADQMAETTIFNDDDILRGERYFATLRNNYDLTIQEIQELMQVTADLASAYGTSFEDASSRVTAAIRGEGEAAEYLGLTMNQQAIDRENLTLTMTNQEAAQFRLNALYEQTGVYQGTAQRLTETEVGTRARLTNAVQDNAQAFAATIGPMTSLTAGMALTASGIGSMIGGFGRLVTAARNSQRAMTALSVAFNPMTLTIGAAATGAYILWNSFQEGERAAKTLGEALKELNAIQEDLILSGEDERSLAIQGMEDYIAHIQEAAEARKNAFIHGSSEYQWAEVERLGLETLGEAYDFYNHQMDMSSEEAERLAAAQIKLGNAMADSRVDAEGLSGAVEELWMRFMTDRTYTIDAFIADLEAIDITDFRTELESTSLSIVDFREDLKSLLAIAEGGAPAVTDMAGALDVFKQGMDDGSISTELLRDYLTDLDIALAEGNITLEMYRDMVIAAANDTDRFSESVDKAMGSLGEMAAEAAQAADDLVRSMIGLNREAATGALDILNAGLTEMIGNFEDAGESAGGMLDGVTERARGELEELIGYAEEFIASMQELAGIDMADKVNMAGLGTDATQAAAAINDVGSALDSVLTIYGSIDAMSSRMSQAGGIADALFGPDGDPYDAVGPLRDVFDAGLISVEQFNSAIADGIEIQRSAATSELYLNKIRADQLPLLRETTDAYQAQIKAISEMSAADQMVALGWMDSGMQGRVEQFTEMISLMNNFGEDGAAAMQQVIDGIVATDPVLTAMLEDLGLIEQQLDGSYTLSLDAEGAVSDIERLTRSIDALTVAMGGDPPSYDIDVTGVEDLEDAQALIDAMNDNDITVNFGVTGVEDAKTALRNALGDVGGGDGEGVTVPVNLQLPTDLPPLPEPEPVTVPISFDWGGAAGAVGGAVSGALGAFGDGEGGATVVIDAIDNASSVINDVISAASSIPESEQVAVSAPGATGATAELNAVTAAANAIPEIEVITVVASGATEAANALNAVAAAANSIPSSVTTTVTTVNRTVNLGTNNSVLPGGRHGGMPGYAMGGVLFEGGEAGMELAHFATGGVALMPRHAIYEAPRGTYIEPANSVGPIGGPSITVNVNGPVFGMTDLAEQVSRELVPVIADVFDERYRGHGVR